MNEPIFTVTIIDLMLFMSNLIITFLYLHEKSHHDRTHEALDALVEMGILDEEETN